MSSTLQNDFFFEREMGQQMGRAWFFSEYCLTQNGKKHVSTNREGTQRPWCPGSTWCMTLVRPGLQNMYFSQRSVDNVMIITQKATSYQRSMLCYRQIRSFRPIVLKNSSRYFPTTKSCRVTGPFHWHRTDDWTRLYCNPLKY